VIARGRLRLLRRAVDCFGFHLANLDMRQNSAVHERTVAELIDAAMPGMSYLALNEEARISLLTNELRNTRPLASAFVKYSDETVGELAVLHAAAEAHIRFGAEVIPQMHHLHVRGGVRHAGGRAALERGRPGQSLRPQRDQHRAAVRDHRGLQASAAIMDRMLSLHDYRKLVDSRGLVPGSDARLFRQQQGRRLRHLGLGALQGRNRLVEVFERHGVRCGCFTAEAARSAAAAGRATTPSSRNPAAR
jgi:phosphoenolpyruvate carboxylase